MTIRTRIAAQPRSTAAARLALKHKLKQWRAAMEPLEPRWLMSTLDISSGQLVYSASTASAITLSVSGSTETLADTAATITLSANATSSGWSGSGTNTVTGPTSSFSSLNISTSSTAGQSLTLNYAGGDPVPAAGVTYSPTAATGGAVNSLTLQGATFTTETYTGTGAAAGNITYSDSTNSNVPLLFSNLSAITDTAVASSFTFDAPAGASTVDLVNGSAGTDEINDGGTSAFTLINFANKVDVTLNVATTGATINLNASTAATALTTLNVNATAVGETININSTPAAVDVTAAGAGGADFLNVNGTGSSGNLTLTTAISTAASNVSVIANSEPVSLSLNANATVSIGSTGGNGSLAGIQSSVSITDFLTFYTLAFHDESDPTGHVWNFADQDSTDTASIGFTGGGSVTYKLTDISSLAFNGGSGGNTYNLATTTGYITTNLSTGAGNDIVNVLASGGNNLDINGQGGTDVVNLGGNTSLGMQTLTGFIALTNVGGSTTLNLDDASDTLPRDATLTDGGTSSLITFLSLSSIQYIDSQISAVNLQMGSADNTFTVIGNTLPVAITGGAGDDTVNINANGAAPTITAGGSAGSVGGFDDVTTTGVDNVSVTNTPPPVITPGSAQILAGVEGSALTSVTLGSFTLPMPSIGSTPGGLPPSAFTATIAWGDGTTTAATLTVDPSTPDLYFIGGTHTYSLAGSYTATPSITLAATTFSTTLNGVAVAIPIAAISATAGTSATVNIAQAPVIVSALPLSSTNDISIPAGPVATFTQPGGAEAVTHYTATIGITDGSNNTVLSTSAASITLANGVYTVNASAITLPFGDYTLHVTVTETPSLDSAGATAPVTITQLPVVVTALPLTGLAGTAISAGPVATFTQPGASETVGHYAATIVITDANNATVLSTAASSITLANGVYTVNAAAITLPVGSYTLHVTVTETPSSDSVANTAAILITDTTLTAGAAVDLTPNTASAFTATVGTFSSSNTALGTSNFTALIAWGDGTTSSGTITQPGGAGTAFVVSGTHTYAAVGDYTTAISVTSATGATVALAGAAAVTDFALSGGVNSFSAVQGAATGTIVLATFTSANPLATAADFTATLPAGGWGDGTPASATPLTITALSSTANSTTFEVTASHTYIITGSLPLNVTVTPAIGAAVNLTAGTATVAHAPITKILAITTQARKVVAGKKTTFVVQLKTLLKKLNKADTSAVTLTITGNGATLSGVTTVNAVKGVAVFKNFFFTTAGVYTITATDTFNTIISKTITVVPAALASLVISTPPASVTTGVAISPAVTVTARDAFGNLVANNNLVKIILLTAPLHGKLTGTALVGTKNGVATFSKLIVKIPGTYALKAVHGKVVVTTGTFTAAAAITVA
jgi:hypothetical protein